MNELELVKQTRFNGIELDCYVEPEQEDRGDFWATREQIGRLLEYEEPMKAVAKIHERHAERLDKFSTIVKLTQVEGSREVSREVTVYSFKGLLEICRYSNQPKADAVMDWLFEVADEIRRSGSYILSRPASPEEKEYLSLSEMRIRVQRRTNELEAAKILQRMIETPAYMLSEEDKRKLTRKIAQSVCGTEVETLPEVKYYPAAELAKEYGLSEDKLMKRASAQWLIAYKSEVSNEYGKWEAGHWKFSEAGLDALRQVMSRKGRRQ